jgi:hypothetical protein
MPADFDARATRFTKSRLNRGTEKSGLSILLRDPRFQLPDVATKRRLIELIGHGSTTFGVQTFDLVMTPEPRPPITVLNVDGLFGELTLVEMKVTKKAIKNEALNGFFFGATERERAMAAALGEKYLFAFVVLTDDNEYGKPFAVLLPLVELERRTGQWRVQYQVSFRTDLTAQDVRAAHQLVFFGLESDLEIEPEGSSSGDVLGE